MLAVVTLAMSSGRRKKMPIPSAAVIRSMIATEPLPSSMPSSSPWTFALRMSQRVPTTRVS